MNEKRKIVFATNNAHKLAEIRAMMGDAYEVMSLAEIGCHDDIPETAATLEGNAEQKARYVKEHYGYDCFADDTGLFVDALGGEPGIYSARYAGDGHDSRANMQLLLSRLQGVDDRQAHFSTVIACVEGDKATFHHGRVDGVITTAPAGVDGFGYDPVFRPDGYAVTFAEMPSEEKNAISHRRRAVEAFVDYLSQPSSAE